MDKLMKITKENLFSTILILITCAVSLYTFQYESYISLVGIVTTITGIFCVVLTAKGHISCYTFGILNIIGYAILSMYAKFYGEVALNVVYYLPMQFVGIHLWKKNLIKDSKVVKGNVMSMKEFGLLAVITVIGVLGLMGILRLFGGNLPLLDSMSTVFSIIAMYLSVKMYAEQWILWIIIDVITVIMWVIALKNGEPESMAMVIMWSAYLVNAIYGYIVWRKNSKELVGA